MHEDYARQVQSALAEAGPAPEIEVETRPLMKDELEALQKRQEERRKEYFRQQKEGD